MLEMQNTYEKILSDTKEHSLTFSYKTIFEHFLCFIKLLPKQLPKIATLFISIWAISEIILFEDNNKLHIILVPSIIIVIVMALYDNLQQYLKTSPDILLSESKKARKLFFHQKLGWQYAIAKEMLENRIIELELSLIRIRQNAEYIVPNFISDDDFIIFIKLQPENILRLIEAAKIACVHFLPNAISTMKKGEEIELNFLLKEINNVAMIYSHAINYERSIYAIKPSEEFEAIHELMKGWTDPIRDGINQFINLLEKLSTLKRKDLKNLKNTITEVKITFSPPKNIDDFQKSIDAYIEKDSN
jgi:hypothetical protein